MDRKKVLIAGFIILAIIALGTEFIEKTKNGGLDTKQVEIVHQQTYEQGLWDGFNRTIEYLDSKGYLIEGKLKIEITEVDSVLHSTKR
jgi:hypothetical protein